MVKIIEVGLIILCVIAFLTFIIYDSLESDRCSKCDSLSKRVIKTYSKQQRILPNGYDQLFRYRCNNCGHTWDEFIEENRD